MNYKNLLKETEKEAQNAPLPDSEEEEFALARFAEFFSSMEPQLVEKRVDNVYAENAILYDTIAFHRGIDEIKPYFIRTAERADGVKVEIIDTLRKGNDFYVKWIMHITWSAFKKGETTTSPGMSHLRFNSKGQVIFHFDFWDSTYGFFEHFPLLGGLIRWIKRKAS